MASFLGTRRSRYTLERLKCLYSDLLQSIDISREDLGRRGCLEDDREDSNAKENTKDNTTTNNNDTLHFLHDIQQSLALISMMYRRRRRTSPFKRLSVEKRHELATAFRVLAATRAPDKEGDNGGAVVLRDDACASALATAKRIEKAVVKIIREMGEVVANCGQTAQNNNSGNLSCDPCFEYFCEKNMLSLLVDIAKQNPNEQTKAVSAQHGVVWSPLVKAQVLHTVSLLISSGGRNSHTLFYILSQNAINDLISCMLPLQRWTDPAMEKLVPPLVDMLKNLGLQLAGTPDLFPFFTRQDSFPLYHAALEIATSAYAQTDSFIHITCLSIIVNIMKINNPSILAWVSAATPELRKLSHHFCQLLLNRYYRIADLSTGQIVDGIRCNAVQAQIVALHDQIHVLNDVFGCGMPGLNVRLCELLVRRVISVVLQNLQPPNERAFISVGVSDLDVIPSRESMAQVSCLFLAQLFRHVDYVPLLRMLAVALFHPKSTSLLVNCDKKLHLAFGAANKEDYVFVPALDAIAKGKGTKSDKTIDNPFRRSLLRTLRGDFGEWRFPVAAIVVDSVLQSDAFDIETLQILEIIPRANNGEEDHEGNTEKEEKTETVRERDNNGEDDNGGDIDKEIKTETMSERADNSEEDNRGDTDKEEKTETVSDTDTEGEQDNESDTEKEEKTETVIERAHNDKEDNQCETDKQDKTETVSETTKAYDYKPTGVEQSLTNFLLEMPKGKLSSVSKICLECAGSLALTLLHSSSINAANNDAECGRFEATSTPLCQALFQAKAFFCRRSLESQKNLVVSAIFLELAEFAVCSRYKKVAPSLSCDGIALPSYQPTTQYACHLSQIGCAVLSESAELLVRKFRFVNYTDVEEARFHIEMAIHFRALCKTMVSFSEELDSRAGKSSGKQGSDGARPGNVALDLIEVADDLALTFGGLGDRPDVRMDLDLRGRMTFPCFLSTGSAAVPGGSSTGTKMTKLVLVVDPTDFYVVKEHGGSRGDIVCRVGLQKVIAAASDAKWLHLAVRHHDVGSLIKNGNMILQFENAGTCLIVREYLDRSRNTVRRELMDRFRTLMEPDAAVAVVPIEFRENAGSNDEPAAETAEYSAGL